MKEVQPLQHQPLTRCRVTVNFLFSVHFTLLLTFVSCAEKSVSPGLFTSIESEISGITFNNQIEIFENDSLNALEYDVLFNGAGVGIGDFDNDGLQDIFFAGNLVSSRLYLNKDNFEFLDITVAAGVTTNKWCTGVSVADINLDGLQDIYVSVAHAGGSPEQRSNLLFMNQGVINGIPTFKEESAILGLDDTGFSIQSAFFDFDRDGDLDCYILTNAMEKTGRNRLRIKQNNGQGESNDRLYENIGVVDGRPLFKNISSEAGILKEGHGLGLCITDLDQDGWLDIYCANDFVSNDLIWMNNGDGTFTDRADEYLRHTSYNSMGADIQDFNNDGLPDICVVDMLPESEQRRKMMVMKTNTDYFKLAQYHGYQDEYVRNVLQLNQGKNSKGNLVFSEIGQLAGIHATDWSWAPLLADLDNDGLKDLVISNGYRRDITNLDYAVYLNQASSFHGMTEDEARSQRIRKLYELPEVKLRNYVYRNNGDLRFQDVSMSWGFNAKSYSNGTAYADLDNDGDLDLVFNNIDSQAGIYRNELFSHSLKGNFNSKLQYVKLKLVSGKGVNKAIGAKVLITRADGVKMYQENLPIRGYMSSVDPVLLFGLGDQSSFTVSVTWADGKYQEIPGLTANTTHTITYIPELLRDSVIQTNDTLNRIFEIPETESLGLTYVHEEDGFNELKRTFTLHQQYNRLSPGLAVGDVDNNGLDDVFIGGDPGMLRAIYLQTSPGKFKALAQGSNRLEDMGALIFDADKDGDKDLYVVSGGSHALPSDGHLYRDRLYLNDGKGQMTRSEDFLPPTQYSGSVIVGADFDRDGDLDLFRGSRVTAGEYPMIPESYLLRNDDGVFTDVTEELSEGLQKVGMVSSAVWSDYNNDGWFDLIVVGEFIPVTFFKNHQGRLIKDEVSTRIETSGWWNSISSADVDQDGNMDYIVGNLGLNSQYKASQQEPLGVYGSDYDNNGSNDPIFTYYKDGREIPIMVRDVIHEQLPSIINKRFGSYDSFSRAEIEEVLTEEERSRSLILKASEMRSSLLINSGSGKFQLKPLPIEAQISPVFGTAVDDYNGDSYPDLLLVGNAGGFETYTGPYNASLGTLLLGHGDGNFDYMPQHISGLCLEEDQKALASIYTSKFRTHLVTNNNGNIQVLKSKLTNEEYLTLNPLEATVVLSFCDGRTERKEIGYGGGYLTQSSRGFYFVRDNISRIEIFNYSGERTRIVDRSNI